MDLQALRGRCERAFGRAAPDSVLNKVRAIVGSPSAMPPTEEGRLAVAAYAALQNGDEPTPSQLAALQWLIRLTRPAPLVHKGTPDSFPRAEHADTFPEWNAFQTAAKGLRQIGRVDRASPTLATAETIGTGVLVPPDLLLTNKHVVQDLSRGTDVLEEGQAVVRFDWEDGSFAADDPVPIIQVARIHDTLDLACLRLKRSAVISQMVEIPFEAAPLVENNDLVVVGYPVDDEERNPMFIRNIFGASFGVLRAAPGQCTGVFADGFYHDSSTLGGNSGSPVFAMQTASLVGLHAGGGFLWKNTAIAGAAVAAFIAASRH